MPVDPSASRVDAEYARAPPPGGLQANGLASANEVEAPEQDATPRPGEREQTEDVAANSLLLPDSVTDGPAPEASAPENKADAQESHMQDAEAEAEANESSEDEAMISGDLTPDMADVKIDTTVHPKLGRPRTLESTLFDRLEKLYGPGVKRMLTIQYR